MTMKLNNFTKIVAAILMFAATFVLSTPIQAGTGLMGGGSCNTICGNYQCGRGVACAGQDGQQHYCSCEDASPSYCLEAGPCGSA